MQYTREQRLEKGETLSPELRELYDAPRSGEVLLEVFTKYALPEKDYKTFAITVGEVILGFYAKSQLPELFHRNIGIPEMIAGKISDDLADFLSIVPDIVAPPLDTSPTVVASVQTSTTATALTTPIPTQTPPPLYKKETVVGARTMQSDIAGIKKEEERRPFIAEKDKVAAVTAAPIPSIPVPPPQITPPPLVRGAVPGQDAPVPAPIPRYSKPLTDLPRYNNLK